MKAIGASPGYAVGKVLRLDQEVSIPKKQGCEPKEEKERLAAAIVAAGEEIDGIIETTKVNVGEDEARIFESHRMMLDDPEFISAIHGKLDGKEVNAEWAVDHAAEEMAALFEGMDNAYLRERAADIRDVAGRLIRRLLGVVEVSLANLAEPVILVARDLTPSDTAQLNKDMVLGFATEIGGSASHTAIMARTLEIPAVVGAGEALETLENGQIIAIDGVTGHWYDQPDDALQTDFNKKRDDLARDRESLKSLIGLPSVTEDGSHLEVVCNIGSPSDVEAVLENDGEGIGLFRSEFLYMDRTQMPSEEEQYEAYKQVLTDMGDKPVIIRTLDVGGDKQLSYLNMPKEENPFLGWRAVRYCLDTPDVFKVQLRALLRAGVHGNLRIMVPMISHLEQFRAVKALVAEVEADLSGEGVTFSKKVPLGIMVEIPAAAMMADLFAKEVDFFSIGTNDLLQYTTAVDRMHEKLADLYTPYHPGLIRLVAQVTKAANAAGIPVGMCGEAAADPKLVPVWLGLGLQEFSVSAPSVLKVRRQIRAMGMDQARELAGRVLEQGTVDGVKGVLGDL